MVLVLLRRTFIPRAVYIVHIHGDMKPHITLTQEPLLFFFFFISSTGLLALLCK